MTLLAKRTKLITFRVSEEEYAVIRQACISKGIRSISELTRAAVLQQLASTPPSRNFITGDLIALVSALEQIDSALKDLSAKISKVLGPVRKPSS